MIVYRFRCECGKLLRRRICTVCGPQVLISRLDKPKEHKDQDRTNRRKYVLNPPPAEEKPT